MSPIVVRDPAPLRVAAAPDSVIASANFTASTVGPTGAGGTDADVAGYVASGVLTAPAVDARINTRIDTRYGTVRSWGAVKNLPGAGDTAATANIGLAVVSVTCTGAPVGAVLLAIGVAEWYTTVAGNLALSIASTSATAVLTYPGTSPLETLIVNNQSRVPVQNLFTVTTANPAIVLTATPTAASTAKGGCSLIVIRVL